VLTFNPHGGVALTAHHGNIKGAQFDLSYFERFDLVLNALDNVEARRHVNRMCLAADRPLIESGTQVRRFFWGGLFFGETNNLKGGKRGSKSNAAKISVQKH
jgi:hypothetical protein